jgi:dTDP-4-dehydrorhamnose 3,5-epimerase
VYVPEGFAHGCRTLEDDTEAFHQMAEFYHPESARGVRWDDPAFGMSWPKANPIVSQRDTCHPNFEAGNEKVINGDPRSLSRRKQS